jgi:hypothetical protein
MSQLKPQQNAGLVTLGVTHLSHVLMKYHLWPYCLFSSGDVDGVLDFVCINYSYSSQILTT